MKKEKKLGVPTETREAFDLLFQEKMISKELCEALQKMVGFGNLVVHNYQKVNLDIVRSIIERQLSDFEIFTKIALQLP